MSETNRPVLPVVLVNSETDTDAQIKVVFFFLSFQIKYESSFVTFQCVQRGCSVLFGTDVRKPQGGLDQPAAALPHQGAKDQ